MRPERDSEQQEPLLRQLRQGGGRVTAPHFPCEHRFCAANHKGRLCALHKMFCSAAREQGLCVIAPPPEVRAFHGVREQLAALEKRVAALEGRL